MQKLSRRANENPGPDVGQARKCGGVPLFNRIPTFSSRCWNSKDNTDINNEKPSQNQLYFKKDHSLSLKLKIT
jgi:hypothetical protein